MPFGTTFGMMKKMWVLLLLASLYTNAQTWTQLPDFPGTARDDAASFAIDGKIYVGTGREVGFGYTNDWFCYDPGTETWSAISSLPATPRQYCTTFTVADTAYVFGGTSDLGPNNELWAYYPGTDVWEQRASLPAEARYACVATELYQGMGIVATGMLASGSPTNEAWKYDAAQDTWQATGDVPGPARHRAACFESGGGLAVIGGADSAFTPLLDAWWYPGFFETGEWYTFDSLPAARWGADGSGNSVHLIACGATAQQTFHSEVWKYGNGWEPTTSFPSGTRRGGVGAGIAGPQTWANTFFYGLGLDGTFARRNDWWQLDILVGITEPDRISEFTLFPVPASTEFWITVHPNAIGAELIIRTADGRVIEQRRIREPHFEIDAKAFANGSYLIQLNTTSGTTVQRTVIMH